MERPLPPNRVHGCDASHTCLFYLLGVGVVAGPYLSYLLGFLPQVPGGGMLTGAGVVGGLVILVGLINSRNRLSLHEHYFTCRSAFGSRQYLYSQVESAHANRLNGSPTGLTVVFADGSACEVKAIRDPEGAAMQIMAHRASIIPARG